MMFYPHGFGKYQQTSTYSSVKEHIMYQVQKSYDYGADIAVSIRDGKKFRHENSQTNSAIISTASDATNQDYGTNRPGHNVLGTRQEAPGQRNSFKFKF